MNVVDKKRLLMDGNYYKQLVCFGFFFSIAIIVFSLQVIMALGKEKLLLTIVVYGAIVLIPFGYFLGLRKLYGVIKDIIKINAKKFKIVEKKVIDKQVVNNSSTTNDTQIVFSEDDGVWVGRKKSREIKVGDICYVFYLDGDTNACAIYSTRENTLDDELKEVLA